MKRPHLAQIILTLSALASVSANAQNQAIYLDGTTDGLSLPGNTSLALTDAFTLEAWIRYD